MKRTKKINIELFKKEKFKKQNLPADFKLTALAGSISAFAFLMSSCSSGEPELYMAKSVNDCQNRSYYSFSQCQTIYKKALKEAREEGPRFGSMALCEEQAGIGECVSYKDEFIPEMKTFAVNLTAARAFYNANKANRSFNESYYSNGGYYSSNSSKSSNTYKTTSKSKQIETTKSRGGFGSTASAKSSWGSSKSWGG